MREFLNFKDALRICVFFSILYLLIGAATTWWSGRISELGVPPSAEVFVFTILAISIFLKFRFANLIRGINSLIAASIYPIELYSLYSVEDSYGGIELIFRSEAIFNTILLSTFTIIFLLFSFCEFIDFARSINKASE